MRTATKLGTLATLLFAMAANLSGLAQATGLNETVGQLLHRDAQEAIAGSAPVLPAPPRLLPDVLLAPMAPPPPPLPVAAPTVTAIYGAPGRLSVVLQMDRQRVVLDQRTGKPEDGVQPMRLTGVNGNCARIVLAPRQPPQTLCVASSFGLARRGGGLP